MATTDSNGLVILQDTDNITPLHTTINTVTASVSNYLTANKTVHYVANTAARATLVTSYTPTSSNPLIVWRGDATVGQQIEFTTDGTNWFHVNAYATGAQPNPIAMGTVSITPSAPSTPTSTAVTFPAGLFTTAPTVMTNPVTTVPGTTVLGTSANGVTATGCNITVSRTSTVATVISWLAVGV